MPRPVPVDSRFIAATKCLAWKVGGERPYWLIVTTVDALTDKHGNRYQFSLRAPASESDRVPGWTMDMISQFLEALEHQPCRMSPALSCPQEGLKKLDGTPSKIASSCFCRDADLGAFSCRDGKFEFVSLFGMTKDETEAMFALEAKKVLEFLWVQSTPHGLMDFERESHLNAETSRPLREEAAESVARSGNGLGNRHGVRGQGNGETESERHEGNETSNGNCTGHGSQRGVEIGFQGAVLGVQGAIRPSGVPSSTV